jgi:hypothetical protein
LKAEQRNSRGTSFDETIVSQMLHDVVGSSSAQKRQEIFNLRDVLIGIRRTISDDEFLVGKIAEQKICSPHRDIGTR